MHTNKPCCRRQSIPVFLLLAVAIAAAGLILSSCGAAAGVGGVTSNLISGFAVKGPIRDGTVLAYELLGDGSKGELLAEGSTDQKGAFQLTIEDYEGPVWI